MNSIDEIHADALNAANDYRNRKERIRAAFDQVGAQEWCHILEEAKQQLVAHYGHPHIPMALVANRACEIVEATS